MPWYRRPASRYAGPAGHGTYKFVGGLLCFHPDPLPTTCIAWGRTGVPPTTARRPPRGGGRSLAGHVGSVENGRRFDLVECVCVGS